MCVCTCVCAHVCVADCVRVPESYSGWNLYVAWTGLKLESFYQTLELLAYLCHHSQPRYRLIIQSFFFAIVVDFVFCFDTGFQSQAGSKFITWLKIALKLLILFLLPVLGFQASATKMDLRVIVYFDY